MNIKKLVGAGIVAGAVTVSSFGAAGAAITFDSAAGTGFVGKGDVQYTFGWNNKELQNNLAGVEFTYVATDTTVTEVSWVCTKGDDNFQERERTTTTTTSINGVVEKEARVKNQVTGINLMGYDDKIESSSSTTEGPKLNSCPTNWVLTPAGDPVIDEEASSSTGGLFVSHSSVNGGEAVPLQEKPATL